MTDQAAAADPRPRPVRRRDRHGRGLRGALAPPSVPLAASRSRRFDDLVVDAVQRIGRRQPAEVARLGGLEIVVTDLPPARLVADGSVPLGHARPPTAEHAARLVVHRRPVEARVLGHRELQRLVRDVVAEQLALLLGVEPEDLDPGWSPR